MSNVFMLNMCYDVPVKLFSFHHSHKQQVKGE